ncbi:MAG: ABC transporter ATP-binding protein, partial [Planctomycetota bacterium]
AVRLLLKRPAPLVGSIACSLLVAVLWGGNIGILYPVLEVTLRGQSIQEWQGEGVAELEAEAAEIQQTLAALPQDGDDINDERQRLLDHQADLDAKLATRRRLLGYARLLPDDAFQTVVVLVAAVMVMTTLRCVFAVGNLVTTTLAVQHASVNLQQDYMDLVTRLDLTSYDRLGVSALTTNFTETLEHVTRGLHTLLGVSIREPLKIASCAVLAACISWRMLLIALVAAPLAALLIGVLAKRIRHTTAAQVGDSIYLNKLVLETITALPVVQACTTEPETRERIGVAARQRKNRTVLTTFLISLSKPVVEVLGLASICAVLLSGAYLLINQEVSLFGLRIVDEPLSIGQMMTFFGLLVGMSDPARKMTEVFSTLQVAVAAADRLYAVADTVPRVADPPRPVPLADGPAGIAFDRVTFGYDPQHPVLHELSLDIAAGETVAFVGRNGCGKSTLTKLLMRFYDAQQGAVTVGGVDTRAAALADLRGRIASVPQHATLFDDTVANNIRYGSPDATMAEVAAAAKRARAHAFITEQLADGYETRVGHDGHNLSGGQRQRVALARALLRDPKVLVLDEATSQIDLQSELLMREALAGFVDNVTCLIITHRPAFLELADRI